MTFPNEYIFHEFMRKAKSIKYYVLTEKGKELLGKGNKLVVGASE
jgi:DNA-binding PadR family transcriptional regulator